MPFYFAERWKSYTDPLPVLGMGLKFLWNAFRNSPQTTTTTTATQTTDRSFAALFKTIGHRFAAYEETTIVPSLISSAHGIVIELGPAAGNQLPRFDQSKVTKLYGVEPNVSFADVLRAKAVECGFTEEGFVPVFCGIEDRVVLEGYGIGRESVDCVTSIGVLCSVDDVQKAVGAIWEVLKPGGELIFWEHERNSDWASWVVQNLYKLPWKLSMGGCRLNRPVGKMLLSSADWEIVKFERDSLPWSLMPRVQGRLRKPLAPGASDH